MQKTTISRPKNVPNPGAGVKPRAPGKVDDKPWGSSAKVVGPSKGIPPTISGNPDGSWTETPYKGGK